MSKYKYYKYKDKPYKWDTEHFDNQVPGYCMTGRRYNIERYNIWLKDEVGFKGDNMRNQE